MSLDQLIITLAVLFVLYYFGRPALFDYAIKKSFINFEDALSNSTRSREYASKMYLKDLTLFNTNYKVLFQLNIFTIDKFYVKIADKYIKFVADAENKTNLTPLQQANQLEKKYLLLRAQQRSFLQESDYNEITDIILKKRNVKLVKERDMWVKK